MHGQIVCVICHQIFGAICGAALKYQTFLCSNLENFWVIRMEDHTSAATLKSNIGAIRTSYWPIIKKQGNDRGNCQFVLHQDPIEHASISGDRIKIYLSVLHIGTPFDLQRFELLINTKFLSSLGSLTSQTHSECFPLTPCDI